MRCNEYKFSQHRLPFYSLEAAAENYASAWLTWPSVLYEYVRIRFSYFLFRHVCLSGSCICVCNSTSCQVHFIEVEMPPLLTAMPGQDVLLLVSSCVLRKFFVFVLIPCLCWENAVRVNSRRFECAARLLVWKSTICKAQRRRLTASLFVGKCVLSYCSITFYVR